MSCLSLLFPSPSYCPSGVCTQPLQDIVLGGGGLGEVFLLCFLHMLWGDPSAREIRKERYTSAGTPLCYFIRVWEGRRCGPWLDWATNLI